MKPSFRIDLSFRNFVNELKAALKKFQTFKADLTLALAEIEENPRAGDQIPNRGADLFKIRLGVKGRIGKRGGYRMIYHVDWTRLVITPIALYFKGDIPHLPDHEVTRRFDELAAQVKFTTTVVVPPTSAIK